jgi:hypothetical protein
MSIQTAGLWRVTDRALHQRRDSVRAADDHLQHHPPSGDPIAGTLTYSGATLSLSTVTGNTFSTQWSNINIPIDVGHNTAYVGFTGSLYTAPSTQDATAWTFAN